MENKVLKRIALVIGVLAIGLEIFKLYEFFRNIKWANFEVTRFFILLHYVFIFAACVTILICLWKEKNLILRLVACALLAVNSIVSIVRGLVFGNLSLLYIISEIVVIIAAVLVVLFMKRCLPYVVIAVFALSIFALVIDRNSAPLVLMAGVILNVISTRNAAYEKITEKLSRLKKQYDAGRITAEEYSERKRKILSTVK